MESIADEVCAVVPVKRLSLAKQRLSSVLSDGERVELARTMLIDVLTNLCRAQGTVGIVVVSSDPAVATIAAHFDACMINDPLEKGLNGAVARGLHALKQERIAALVVPADVPFATADDFDAVIRALRQYPVVLAPASSDGGTNALAMRSVSLVPPCFGEDSFIRHKAAARLSGLDCGTVCSRGLGHDVDCPRDLIAPIVSRPSPSMTSQLLAELNLVDRLGVGALPACVRYM